MINRVFFLLVMLFLSPLLHAQENNDVSMADQMCSNGKIYVVVAVVLTIFAGIIIYLVRLDRKMTRLEKERHIK
ncbi:MAG: CcmD family protein [Flavisolibacter sp.]